MRFAVVGLGSAGARHARQLLERGHAVVGFDPGTSPSGDIERAGSFEEAIGNAEAVIVASPNSLHAEQAVAALQQGRHVLVEKPLAVTAADAERVLEAAERAARVCGVAMNMRFHPGVLMLKRLLAEGDLGPVAFAQASFGYDLRLWHPESDYRRGYSARAELGGGIVLDAIHELDYLLWLLGPVTTVSAEAAHVSDLEIDVEDIAVAILRFESGAIGAIDLNFFEPAYRRGCLVVGSDAVARWDWHEGTVSLRSKGDSDRVIGAHCELTDTYRAELEDFAQAIENGHPPRTPVTDGVAAVRVAEALKDSALTGRRIAVGLA
jgi:predicted dehydrogenase